MASSGLPLLASRKTWHSFNGLIPGNARLDRDHHHLHDPFGLGRVGRRAPGVPGIPSATGIVEPAFWQQGIECHFHLSPTDRLPCSVCLRTLSTALQKYLVVLGREYCLGDHFHSARILL